MGDEQLRQRFQSLAPSSVPSAPDRHQQVRERLRNQQRQRYSIATTALVVAGLTVGAVALGTASDHRSGKTVSSLSTAFGNGLQLRSTVKHSFSDGKTVSLDEVLSGESVTTGRYGWIVNWGDGGYDRAYGSAGCPPAGPHHVSEEHVFDHRYAVAGTYRVSVQVTLCGERQLQWTGNVPAR